MSNRQDDDLDDLDDYLDEFQEEILSQDYEQVKKENASKGPEGATSSSAQEDTNGAAQEQQILESLLKSMDQEDPNAAKSLEALLQGLGASPSPSASTSTSNTNGAVPELKDTISSTLNRLKESGAKVDQSIKDEQVPGQEMLADLLAQLNMDGEGGDEEGLSNLLNEMLGALASKEVLFEPLKDLDKKYPLWLQENKDKTAKEEYERYTNQAAIVRAIITQFEAEDYSPDNKEQRAFVSAKLEEMQESGDPPKDLMGDMDKLGLGGLGGLDFDGDDLPPDMEKELGENCQQQ